MSKFKDYRNTGIIIFIILVFRSVCFEPFKIPSGSMIPTLLIGDFILVNKMSYGIKVPFTEWTMFYNLTGSAPIYLNKPKAPQRGDIIVFRYPKNPDLDYIKRVVAIPGDRVSVVDKQVYLNNELIKLEDFPKTDALVNRITQQNGDNNYYGPQIKITKNGDVSHLMQITTKNSPLSNYEEIIIPEGHFFVMGDNRDNSADSRDWGLVPFENIKGKAFLVWFNLNLPFLQPDGVAETPFMFFPERIGKLVY